MVYDTFRLVGGVFAGIFLFDGVSKGVLWELISGMVLGIIVFLFIYLHNKKKPPIINIKG